MKNRNLSKSRELDAKAVTQVHSVQVSFANRKENGDSFAKEPTRAVGAWAEPRIVGHAVKFSFIFSNELTNVYSI